MYVLNYWHTTSDYDLRGPAGGGLEGPRRPGRVQCRTPHHRGARAEAVRRRVRPSSRLSLLSRWGAGRERWTRPAPSSNTRRP